MAEARDRMNYLRPSGGRPEKAGSAPFSLALVVVAVQLLALLYLRTISQQLSVGNDFLGYQQFMTVWTAGGNLQGGWAHEFMKVNLLFALYLWVTARSIGSVRHRWSLVGAAWILLAVQSLWALSPILAQARFVLVALER